MCLIWLDPLGKSDIRWTPGNLYQNDRKLAVSLFHLGNKFLPHKSCLPALNLCSIIVCTSWSWSVYPQCHEQYYWHTYRRSYPPCPQSSFCTYVRGTMDSIAICILRRAICILQKFLGNMDIDSKPFWCRRKESILHRNMHTACILHDTICILW